MTGTDRGTGTHNTSATSFTLSPASDLAAGSIAVLCVAADNSSTGGSTNNITSVTDSHGNIWRPRQLPIFDNGAANAGVQGGMFTTDMAAGTLTTGSVITVTFGAATVAKAWTLSEMVPASSALRIAFVKGADSAGATTTTPSVTTGTIQNGNMVIAALFNEQGTGQTVTQDGDTTNGNWSAQQTAEIGSTAAGMTVASQRKSVTATATQTYNPTLGVSSDLIMSWIELTEVARGNHLASLGAGAPGA